MSINTSLTQSFVSVNLGSTIGKINIFRVSQKITGSTSFVFLATFMSTVGTNFYLQGYYFDAGYAAATGGISVLGNVSIQSQMLGITSTLMIHRVLNSTSGIAQVDIQFVEPPFFGNSTIIGIGVIPSQTNLITWTGNFWGYQK